MKYQIQVNNGNANLGVTQKTNTGQKDNGGDSLEG